MVSQTPLPPSMTSGSRVDLDRIILFRSSPRGAPATLASRGPRCGNPDSDSRLDSRLRLDSQHKRVHARLDALCAGMSGGPWPAIFPLELPKNSMVSVVLAVGARLGHGQGALATLLVGIKAPPLRRRPARCKRAGNARVALDRVSVSYTHLTLPTTPYV